MMKKSQPKPPVKKYTAQDSVSYERMMDRNISDVKKMNKVPAFSKESVAVNTRISNRRDSMIASPYYKAKPEASVNYLKKKIKPKKK
jgi:hypothetical protein